LKYNFLCNSVLLGVRLHWLEFWSHLIVPDSNYIEVKSDFSDLLEKHAELEASPAYASRIAHNALKASELLDSIGVSCYLLELIRLYSDVCQWTVEKPELGDVRKPLRAGQQWMSIEDFFLTKMSS
jgi:hypothetical protein